MPEGAFVSYSSRADYAQGDDPNQKTKTSGLKEVGLKEFGRVCV